MSLTKGRATSQVVCGRPVVTWTLVQSQAGRCEVRRRQIGTWKGSPNRGSRFSPVITIPPTSHNLSFIYTDAV